MFMSEIEDLTEDKYRAMVLAGRNSRDICADIGVSTTTLYAYLRANHWPLPTELRRQTVHGYMNPKMTNRLKRMNEFQQRMPVKEYIQRSMNGETVETMAEELNIPRPTLYSYIRSLGWKMPRVIRQEAGIKSKHPGRKERPGRFKRDAEMLAMKIAGATYLDIAQKYGLTEEGARVAVVKHQARLLAKQPKKSRKPEYHHSQKIRISEAKYRKLALTHSIEDFSKMFDVTYHAFIAFLARMGWDTPKTIQVTERNRRIDEMLGEGYTPKQIRRSLGLSQQHYSKIMKDREDGVADSRVTG